MKEIFKLQPACKDYLWGGNRLKTEFGKEYSGDILAETWELSCHPDGPCTIANGTFAGMSLADYLAQHSSACGRNCARFAQFPLLIKFIDAKQSLSVQVHPDDTYALAHEGQFGKTEMWVVVSALPDAFIYYGFSRVVSEEEFAKRIAEGTLTEVLNKVPAHEGDVFFIEAGTIHAIGAGTLIAEIQQNSNLTYRVFDYARKDKDGQQRALHIPQAMAVTHRTPPNTAHNFGTYIGKCDSFAVQRICTQGGEISATADANSFHSVLVLSGNGEARCGEYALPFQKGDSLFIPADTGAYTLCGSFTALRTTVPPYEGRCRIGIDLGGTNIKAGIVDDKNRLLATATRKTHSERPWQAVVEDMAGAVADALKKAGIRIDACDKVGVGCPGTIDAETGEVIYSNNLAWHHVPLAATLASYFPIPVHVSNDANCAALGEVVAGAARGFRNAVLLTLGTGVGGGVVLDGKLFEGGPGGVEIGHMTLIHGGELCTCGRRGCIEAYASASALRREAMRAAEQNPTSALNTLCGGDLQTMNAKIPFDAMRLGDAAATKVVQQYIEWLGSAIVNMVNLFRPEVILLSGGVCYEGETLTAPLTAYMRQYAFGKEESYLPEIRRATLGNDAGIIGAASLE